MMKKENMDNINNTNEEKENKIFWDLTKEILSVDMNNIFDFSITLIKEIDEKTKKDSDPYYDYSPIDKIYITFIDNSIDLYKKTNGVYKTKIIKQFVDLESGIIDIVIHNTITNRMYRSAMFLTQINPKLVKIRINFNPKMIVHEPIDIIFKLIKNSGEIIRVGFLNMYKDKNKEYIDKYNKMVENDPQVMKYMLFEEGTNYIYLNRYEYIKGGLKI